MDFNRWGIYQLIILDHNLVSYISRLGKSSYFIQKYDKNYLVSFNGQNKPILLLSDSAVRKLNISEFIFSNEIVFNNDYICSSFGDSLYIMKTNEIISKCKAEIVKMNKEK